MIERVSNDLKYQTYPLTTFKNYYNIAVINLITSFKPIFLMFCIPNATPIKT